jgi:hypothetical protein
MIKIIYLTQLWLAYVLLASLVRMHPQCILNITWDGREGGFQNLIKL